MLVLCYTSFGISCPPFLLLRAQLVLSQAVIIITLGVLYYILKNIKPGFLFISSLILVLLLLITLFMPDSTLFGDNAIIRILTMDQGDRFIMIGNGFTVWRLLKDVTVFIFVITAFLLLMKKLDDVSFRTIAILYSGLAIVLLSGIYDQLVDLGFINSTYLHPFTFFIFYIILTFIPFVFFIADSIKQQEILQNEKSLQHLVNQSEIIVVSLNRMGIVESINPFFYRLTGYTEEEVIGKDWFEFFIPPKEYYALQGAFVEILEYEFHPQYINAILTKNRQEKMIRWFNVRTLNKQQKITGSLSIGIDISEDIQEKNKIEQKLKEAELLIAKLSSQ
jgi:PAS domain S-box-containing protein